MSSRSKRMSALREQARPHDAETCSMCGEFCVFKIADDEERERAEAPAEKAAAAHKP